MSNDEVINCLLTNDWVGSDETLASDPSKGSSLWSLELIEPFAAFSKHFKVKPDKPAIDDIVFKLHYRATFILLMACTILVSQRQYIGEHIKCISNAGVPDNVMNTFCFFSSTFTVVQHYNESAVAKGYLPHPGVGPVVEDEDEVVHHAYYQWVPFVLFLQALSFFIPHYIWRKIEGGRLQALVAGMRLIFMPYKDDETINGVCLISEANLKKKIETLKDEFISRLHVSHKWSRMLVLCEVMNLLNLMLQIYLTDLFLGGAFWGLGSNLSTFDNWEGYQDPLDIVFPKVTKCTFYKFGPSGNIQNHDAMCVMALNVIHEKIYAILWFWYVVLFVLTVLGLLFRLVIFVMHSRSTKFNEMMFAYACPGRLDIKDVMTVTHRCYFGDWLFLYFLAKNMNPYTFKSLFVSLAEKMDDQQRNEKKQMAMEDAGVELDEAVKSPLVTV